MSLKRRVHQGTGPSSYASADSQTFHGDPRVTAQPLPTARRHYTWILDKPLDPRSSETTPDPADVDLHKAIEKSADVALGMLKTAAGREFLVQVGSKAIKQWKPTQYVYRGRIDEMDNCVEAFLDQICKDFVPVHLIAAQAAIARFWTADWYRKGTREVSGWHPSKAGTLCLGKMVCILPVTPQLLTRTSFLILTVHFPPVC